MDTEKLAIQFEKAWEFTIRQSPNGKVIGIGVKDLIFGKYLFAWVDHKTALQLAALLTEAAKGAQS